MQECSKTVEFQKLIVSKVASFMGNPICLVTCEYCEGTESSLEGIKAGDTSSRFCVRTSPVNFWNGMEFDPF